MRRLSLALAAILLAAFALAPAASAASHTGTGAAVPITFQSELGSFVGNFEIDRFARQGDQLVAIGDLTGTVRNALGAVVGTIDQPLTLPVLDLTSNCDILHLELGPLDLNLLGLQVDLSRIVLDITAESGPGNLLGNLLCGVAGLLDGGAPLNAIARVLNQILGLLG